MNSCCIGCGRTVASCHSSPPLAHITSPAARKLPAHSSLWSVHSTVASFQVALDEAGRWRRAKTILPLHTPRLCNQAFVGALLVVMNLVTSDGAGRWLHARTVLPLRTPLPLSPSTFRCTSSPRGHHGPSSRKSPAISS